MGRPRLKGERLPNLSVVIEDPTTLWTPITVANWYGSTERTVETISETAVWHSTGLPAVPLRWGYWFAILKKRVRHPRALPCTDLDADPERIVSWFVRRWQMEATFQEARQRLGFETQRHWSEMAIRRTRPRCWLCSPWLLCLLTSGWRKARASFAERPGTTRSIRPSPTPPWRW